MKKLRSNGLVFVVVFVCLPFFFSMSCEFATSQMRHVHEDEIGVN